MFSHLERLAEHVTKRRLELGLGVEPAARSAGISKDTWKRVERCQRVRDTTYSRIERALLWAPDSCRQLLSGGRPITVEPSTAAGGVVVASLPKSEMEAGIRRAVESAALAVTDLGEQEIREMNERVMEQLRTQGLI